MIAPFWVLGLGFWELGSCSILPRPPEDSETISRTVDLMSSRIRANLADASPVGKKVLGASFKGCIGFRVWG